MQKSSSVRLAADFSSETVAARKHRGNIFKVLKEKKKLLKVNQYSISGKIAFKMKEKLRHSQINKN